MRTDYDVCFLDVGCKDLILQSRGLYEKREKRECQEMPTAQLYLHGASVHLVIQNA